MSVLYENKGLRPGRVRFAPPNPVRLCGTAMPKSTKFDQSKGPGLYEHVCAATRLGFSLTAYLTMKLGLQNNQLQTGPSHGYQLRTSCTRESVLQIASYFHPLHSEGWEAEPAFRAHGSQQIGTRGRASLWGFVTPLVDVKQTNRKVWRPLPPERKQGEKKVAGERRKIIPLMLS